MTQRRQWMLALAALAALAACGRNQPAPPKGELRSALALPMLAGGVFDPSALADKRTLVTFWSPS